MRILSDVHFIASPTTFCTAPPIPRGATSSGYSNLPLTGRLMQFILGPNFTGLPAMSQPIGHDEQGAGLGAGIPGVGQWPGLLGRRLQIFRPMFHHLKVDCGVCMRCRAREEHHVLVPFYGAHRNPD